MNVEKVTAVHWFFWLGWFTDKVETWLEKKAAEGWHLVKADRLLLRFHFVRGIPKKIRVCADYPASACEEYKTIFQDAGWELVGESSGWYLWRAECVNGLCPEPFNDPDPLIERNLRLLKLIMIALALQVPAQLPKFLLDITKPSSAFSFGPILVTLYGVLIVGLFFFGIMTYFQIRRLRALKR